MGRMRPAHGDDAARDGERRNTVREARDPGGPRPLVRARVGRRRALLGSNEAEQLGDGSYECSADRCTTDQLAPVLVRGVARATALAGRAIQDEPRSVEGLSRDVVGIAVTSISPNRARPPSKSASRHRSNRRRIKACSSSCGRTTARFTDGTIAAARRARTRPAGAARARDVVAFADPEYAAGAALPDATADSRPKLFSGAIARLPGTRLEADDLRATFSSLKLFRDRAATKGAFLSVNGPAILHVGTHGLFRAPKPTTTAAGARTLVLDLGGQEAHGAPAAVDVDPLEMAALVFAGAERGGGRAGSAGVVTARDFLRMNLSATELVTLSACETGLGEVLLGQGVYGFRRALIVAGAATIVTSVWQVDDAATRDLMKGFYTRLARGTGRTEAMQRAALDVRARTPHPFYWAPFTVTGAPGPLRMPALDGCASP